VGGYGFFGCLPEGKRREDLIKYDLVDGNVIIEAEGESPSLEKIKTPFGQLIFYKEHEPSFNVAFLFPRGG